MPHMDGIEATRAIRAMDRSDASSIPIIAMTADAFAEDARKCMEAGMNAHLAKPVEAELLVQTLEELAFEARAARPRPS
jgi:CheY-like chemotaxis protein